MWKKYIPIFTVLIIAVFFRTYHLKTLPPGLYPDEAMNGSNGLTAIHTGDFKVFYPENNGREGLFINLQALLVKWSGVREPWVLRSVSSLFGILTVLGMYFLGKELFSKRIGLLASFLLATNFLHINFSRIGFRAIMAPAFAVWGLYFFIRALRQDRTRPASILAILAGAVFGLGLHSYIAYRVMPALIVLVTAYFLVFEKNRRVETLKKTALFIVAALIVFAPLGMYFLENPGDFFGRTSQVSVFSSTSPLAGLGLNIAKTLGMFNVIGDYNWRHNISGKPELYLPVGLLFLAGIVLAIKKFFKKSSWSAGQVLPVGILLSWFGLAMLPVIISNEGLPHALRAILMLPPVMFFSALGGNALFDLFLSKVKEPSKELWSRRIISFFAALILANAYVSYFIVWGKNPEVQNAFAANYTAIARKLNSLPREVPKYVVVEAGGVLVNGIPMPSQPIMFMTDTFRKEEQTEKNIFYVLPEKRNAIPDNASVFVID
ncbi:MAG: glycosyltransferase family 39 protein [Patescibacteria group bacterium]